MLTSQDAIFGQGKGQRSHKAKNRRKHFRGEIGRAISNLVAVLISDLWAMAGKNGTVFFNNWPPLGAIQTELVVELELALIERKQYRRFRHNSIICHLEGGREGGREVRNSV